MALAFIRRVRRGVRAGLVTAVAASALVGVTAQAASAAAPACTVSAPLTNMVLPGIPGLARKPYVEFSAVNNHGTYGGVAADGYGTFKLLRYDLGLRRVIVLDTMHLNPWDDPRSVTAVGVDNAGAITFKVLLFHPKSADYVGYRYAGGKKYTLWHLPTWSGFEPRTVTGAGDIIGSVTGKDQVLRAVRWTGSGSGRANYVAGANTGDAVADGRGNIAFETGMGSGAAVISPAGVQRDLIGPTGGPLVSVTIWTSSGPWIYGTGQDRFNNILGLRWRTADAAGTGPIFASSTGLVHYANAAGPDGTYVGITSGFPSTGQELYYKPGIPVHHIAPQYSEDPGTDNTPVAVNQAGAVVFTGTDGLPRLENCVA